MLIIILLFALTHGYKPPRSCFYCVDGQESDCVRTKASMRWEEEGCGQLNIPANCTNMAEIMVGLGEDEDATEKLITACGVQLGQCQEPMLTVSKIKTRQCCLDCHKFTDEINQATQLAKLTAVLLLIMLI